MILQHLRGPLERPALPASKRAHHLLLAPLPVALAQQRGPPLGILFLYSLIAHRGDAAPAPRVLRAHHLRQQVDPAVPAGAHRAGAFILRGDPSPVTHPVLFRGGLLRPHVGVAELRAGDQLCAVRQAHPPGDAVRVASTQQGDAHIPLDSPIPLPARHTLRHHSGEVVAERFHLGPDVGAGGGRRSTDRRAAGAHKR